MCFKQADSGLQGNTNREYSVEHAVEMMAHVSSRKCAGYGCSKRPNHGVAGSKKAKYCAEHALGGMVNVVSKKCAVDGLSLIHI